jgi:hypothetical protein
LHEEHLLGLIIQWWSEVFDGCLKLIHICSEVAITELNSASGDSESRLKSPLGWVESILKPLNEVLPCLGLILWSLGIFIHEMSRQPYAGEPDGCFVVGSSELNIVSCIPDPRR